MSELEVAKDKQDSAREKQKEADELVKQALMKSGDARSYDDILVLKSRLSRMQFFMALFSSFMPNQINDICKGVTMEVTDGRSYVFKQGDFGSSFFVILTGRCEVHIQTGEKDPETGELIEKCVHTLLPGNHFGERALEHDEPRSASIYAAETTCMVAMTRKAYKKAMKAQAENEAQISLKEGTKAYTLRVLGKRREDRSEDELRNVAYYLDKRVAYFKKFDGKTQMELSRCCELVSIYGRNILFKQGQIGQAFYIVMSGTCDVIVSTPETDAAGTEGIVVNTLGSGAAFGERALESDEGRTATIVTGDDLTEILVIGKEDYHTLIAELVAREKQEKFDLLKKTHAFEKLDDETLDWMAKYMEPKQFLVDSFIFQQGDKATDMIFVSAGEVTLFVDVVEKDADGKSGHTKHTLNLGRLGSGTVLGDYISMPESFLEDCPYRETCETSTFVTAYVLAKYDLFFRIPKDIQERIKRQVRYVGPSQTGLFQNTIKQVDGAEFRRSQTWKGFRNDYVKRGKKISILETFKAAQAMKLEDGAGNYRKLPPSPREIAANKMKALGEAGPSRRETEAAEEEDAAGRGRGGGRRGKNDKQKGTRLPGFTDMHTKKKTVNAIIQPKKEVQSGPGAPLQPQGYVMGDGCFKYPFALVHLHRERTSDEDLASSRRLIKCFSRLSGSVPTAAAAKDIVSAFCAHAFLKLYRGDPSKEGELKPDWRVFTDFNALPMQHTDVFLVYCRTAIVEYCAFSPRSANFLKHEFPLACRQEMQNFACLSVNELNRPAAPGPNDPPFYLKELGAVSCVQATFNSSLDCANFGRVKAKRAPNGGRLCVLPMYTWLLTTDDAFSRYDIKKITNAQGMDFREDPLSCTHAAVHMARGAMNGTGPGTDGALNGSGTGGVGGGLDSTFAMTAAALDDQGSVGGMSQASLEAEVRLTSGVDKAALERSRRLIKRSLDEFGCAPSENTKEALGGAGIVEGTKKFNALDRASLRAGLTWTVNMHAHVNAETYRHHHHHHGYSADRGGGEETAESRADTAASRPAATPKNMDNPAMTKKKLEADADSAEARIKALQEVVVRRANILAQNDELLSIEAFMAQKRNERHNESRLPSTGAAGGGDGGGGDSDLPPHDGGLGGLNTSSSESAPVSPRFQEELLGTGKGAIDMSLIPKQLSYSIKIGSERGMEIVNSALAKKRVDLFVDMMELPDRSALEGTYKSKARVKRDKQARDEAHARATKEAMLNGKPPPRRMSAGLLSPAGAGGRGSDLDSLSNSSVGSPASATTVADGDGSPPKDDTGAHLYLSYVDPNSEPFHSKHKKNIRPFKLTTQIAALRDLLGDHDDPDSLGP